MLFGHSLGGLIALGYVLDARSEPDLLVLSAPAIGDAIPLWQRLLVGSLRRVAPDLLLSNRLDAADLSSDPAVREAYLARSAEPAQVDRPVRPRGIRGAAARRGSARSPVACRPSSSTAETIASCRPRAATPSRAVRASPVGSTRTSATSSTTSPTGPAVIEDVIAWIRERVSRMHARRNELARIAAVPSPGN